MTANQRIGWIDAVRGLAILAVLSYHVELGMRLSDMHPPESLRIALATLDLVRMPLLMFVAGLALASFSGPGRSFDMWGRFLKLLLPYLVWSSAYAALWYLFPTERNHRDLAELALTPFFPASHLWFLQALLAYTLTVPLLQRMPALVSVALAGAVSFSVGLSGAQLEGDALGIFAPQRALYVWFVLGYLLSGWTISTVARLSVTERVSLGLAGLAILVALAPRLVAYRYLPQSMPIAALGIASAIMPVSMLRADNPIQIFLAMVGQYALEIYVLHIAIISAVRRLLDHTGLFGPGELFVECLIVSTILSLAVAVAVRHTPARRLFYWGARRRPRQLVST